MKHDPLPKWEYNVYLLLSLGIHFYAFYEAYLSSREHEDRLDEVVGLEPDLSLWGLKKDVTDFEWTFWMEWAYSWIIWLMLGHALVSQIGRIFWGKHRWQFLMAYGVAACWWVLGMRGLAAVFLNAVIFYMIAKLRAPLLTWLSSALMLFMLHNETVENTQRGWYGTENEYYLLQFTLTVRCLFYTSFCLEYKDRQSPDSSNSNSFLSMLVYAFYYPLFHNGPIIPFNEFSKQMQRQDARLPDFPLAGLAADVLRLLLWWCLAELMIRVTYMHAMYSDYPVLEEVSYWTLGGLALAQVLFFYVKYLVLYGFPALIMQLDGLAAPALPRCVSTMHCFSGIWRCFDVGLHRFLVRYIYIPMGGSHSGAGGMLLATALTFVFVCYWHGGHGYLWYWAGLNCAGIIVEQTVRKLLSLPSIQERIDRHLSPRTFRQLHAALASVSLAMLILTNLVFLGGEEVGRIYWDRLFVRSWPWVPLAVLSCLYCFTQVGIEWSLFLFPRYKYKFPLCARTASER
ncbi:protein-cysteine N-palmitoyltransferase HHAT isoform X1 [Hyperolius riggenbachi]|uniref:protein-cysteine N-palmitoyltransferase HHAT isoform X1 n=1 Tax=Hyperolius riggenbachi TaxID=752182 RepID=UPI0035A36748